MLCDAFEYMIFAALEIMHYSFVSDEVQRGNIAENFLPKNFGDMGTKIKKFVQKMKRRRRSK
jgi:hypothetical protein